MDSFDALQNCKLREPQITQIDKINFEPVELQPVPEFGSGSVSEGQHSKATADSSLRSE